MKNMKSTFGCALLLAGGIAFGSPLAPFPKWSGPRPVTQGPHEHFLASDFAIDSWSPDGRQIAFNSVHEGSRQVYVRDIGE